MLRHAPSGGNGSSGVEEGGKGELVRPTRGYPTGLQLAGLATSGF